MQLKIGSKVFYPSHGAGKVKGQKDIEFNGEIKKYFEFELITNPISISTPVDNIDSLGIREVMSTKQILEEIKILKKSPSKNPKVTDFNIMLNMFKELEGKSDIKSTMEIIQYCNFIRKQREKEGRLIPTSIEKQLEEAVKNIVGELAIAWIKQMSNLPKLLD
ncbi:MAG: Transcriptional regulator, CarD family [candidate division WS6 bacterium GW2011_WS6_36_26]|nr:MAG: Transcriptional regulator, CarD family [candidate division WS6 bacterium GW2011_WS6_36_26]